MNQLLSKILQPQSLEEMVGQKHLFAPNGIVTKMIKTNQLFSLIFFGLPGTGKSTLAQIICKQTKTPYGFFNPTKHHKSDLDELLKTALSAHNRYVIIIDEIHRMNKDKQDLLLSYLENNQLIVFGTTTENPYFVINPAIRSRCQIFELYGLEIDDIKVYLKQVVVKINLKITDQAIDVLAHNTMGDLRTALNLIDLLVKLYQEQEIDVSLLEMILPKANLIASSYGNEYYDLLSAFHKSLRGSDCDASIYYLAKLIQIGDLKSISRRIIAMAYEDVGLANPTLIARVLSAIEAAERVGFPEAKQILATIVIELCLSPKSDSAYLAINKALADVNSGLGALEIPIHLKDTHYKSAAKLGRIGYKFPHHYPNHWVSQQYLPKAIVHKKYYEAQDNPIEAKMNQALEQRKNGK